MIEINPDSLHGINVDNYIIKYVIQMSLSTINKDFRVKRAYSSVLNLRWVIGF